VLRHTMLQETGEQCSCCWCLSVPRAVCCDVHREAVSAACSLRALLWYDYSQSNSLPWLCLRLDCFAAAVGAVS
jgi:hypothetical protein